jgi:hypothetical protein
MKKSSVLVLVSVLVLLIACNPKSNKAKDEINALRLSYDTSKIAIIPWDSAKYRFENLGYKKGQLTQKDLGMVDSLVRVCVTQYNQQLNLPGEDKEYEIDLNKHSYKWQIVAITNSSGEKEVWVNCFCDEWNKSWKTNILVVHDGGPCYFNLMINLTTQTFYDLMVNGFA